MTFLVTVSMGDCVILAADHAVLDGGVLISEDARKITKTAHGYITASGLVELIEPVKMRFQAEPPETVGEMEEIIEDERLLYLARHYGSPTAAGWVERSSWKLTFPMGTGVVAAFTAPEGLKGLEEGKAMFVYPETVTAVEKQAVEADIAARFKYRSKGGQTSREDIDHNLMLIMQAADYLRVQGRPVSAGIDFAIHHRDWREELTSKQLPWQ